MTNEQAKLIADSLVAIVTELKSVVAQLNFIATQGVFVKIDEDISEN